jgi:hypothetical protein
MEKSYIFNQLKQLVESVYSVSDKNSVQFNIIIRNIDSENNNIMGDIILNSICGDLHLSDSFLDNKPYRLNDFIIHVGYTDDHLNLNDFIQHVLWFIENFTINTSYYKYGYYPSVSKGTNELILYPWIEEEREHERLDYEKYLSKIKTYPLLEETLKRMQKYCDPAGVDIIFNPEETGGSFSIQSGNNITYLYFDTQCVTYNDEYESPSLQTLHDHTEWFCSWIFCDLNEENDNSVCVQRFNKYSYIVFCLKKEVENVNEFEDSLERDGKIYVRKCFPYPWNEK